MSVNKLSDILRDFNETGSCLVAWDNQEQGLLESAVQHLKQVHDNIVLENSQRLSLGSHDESTYNVVASGVIVKNSIKHNDDILSLYMKILKPGGKFILTDAADNIVTTLKLNGFTDVKRGEDFITSQKPNFAVGSSLKLGKKETVWKIDDNIESVWNTDDKENDEIIDSDQLLDEDDLKKPDESSLRVCGTTGLRKACADCSCGLAEELRGETKEEPKSSCGSCYLGDAFRCASCPYLGMPAFKPGEKVLLDLKSDI